MRLELGALRSGLEVLEAVRQRQGLGVEDRELLLDGDREVLRRLVLFAGLLEQLRPPRREVTRRARAGDCATPAQLQRSTTAFLAAFASSARSSGLERQQPAELLGELGRVTRLEARELAVALRILLGDAGRDLGEPRVVRHERQRAAAAASAATMPNASGKIEGTTVTSVSGISAARWRCSSGPVKSARSGGEPLELGAVVAEADDHGPRVDLAERLEQDVDALVAEELPEVEDRRLVGGEERLEPLGVPLVG